MDGCSYLDGQVLQEPLIRFRECIFPLAWITYQYSDLLVLREQWYLDKRALFVLLAVGGCGTECLPILERNGDIRQLESLSDGFNDAWERTSCGTTTASMRCPRRDMTA